MAAARRNGNTEAEAPFFGEKRPLAGTGSRAVARRIPDAERLAVIADAIITSAPDAAQRWGISEHTIWKWTEEAGGLRAIRELLTIHQLGALFSTYRAISCEMRRRLPHLSDDHLVALFIEMIRSHSGRDTCCRRRRGREGR